MKRLGRRFFAQDTVEVAQLLLGRILVFGRFQGLITETEAYRGQDDPASHAFRGRTPRTKMMYGPPGWSYVYMTYGMYHCLNLVTEPQDVPAAVLIRGVKLLNGPGTWLNGPGKLCRDMGIDRRHNNLDITHETQFYVSEKQTPLAYTAGPRIGIKVGLDKNWRFLCTEF